MRFRVVPAAYVLLLRPGPGRGADEVLLQLRRDTGFMDGHWATAAGHVEAGESARAAAVREAAEEVGVRIRPDQLVPLTTVHRTQGTGDPIDERVDFFFGCRSWLGEPRRTEPAKAAELGWFGLDALPDPVVPHERAVLDGLRAGTLPPILTFGFDP